MREKESVSVLKSFNLGRANGLKGWSVEFVTCRVCNGVVDVVITRFSGQTLG